MIFQFDTDTVVREVLQTRKLMLSPIRGCVETSEYIYKDTPILRTEKQPKVSTSFIFIPTFRSTFQSVHLLVILLHFCDGRI